MQRADFDAACTILGQVVGDAALASLRLTDGIQQPDFQPFDQALCNRLGRWVELMALVVWHISNTDGIDARVLAARQDCLPCLLIQRLIKLLRQTQTHRHLRRTVTSYSLRRSFSSWATANGWDLKAPVIYVGWKDITSAIR
ncbi:hypothetical protein FA378_26770 [Pseudomonas aeruginosa]|nr:hypothetical protein [Pseudomonas aeruginosa]